MDGDHSYPYPRSQAVMSIGLSLILTLITCGIYGIFWQYRQIEVLNAWLGRREYSFWLWLLLSLITCGIFAIYYEYKMGEGINEIKEQNQFSVDTNLPLLCVLLSVFGFGIVSLAIQQNEIHKLYRARADV